MFTGTSKQEHGPLPREDAQKQQEHGPLPGLITLSYYITYNMKNNITT